MDSINTLAGPVNAAAFTDESATAYGAAVMAEVAQLVSKTNEVIGVIGQASSEITAVVATASDNSDDIASLQTRMNVVEGFGWSMLTRYIEGGIASSPFTETLDLAEIKTTRLYLASKRNSYMNLFLPADTVDDYDAGLLGNGDGSTGGYPPITIMAKTYGGAYVDVKLTGGAGYGFWGNEESGKFIRLLDNEFVTVAPFIHDFLATRRVRWFILGGKTYADLQS